MQVVLGIPKHPHLPKAENKLPQNTNSVATVMAGGWQKMLGISRKYKVQRLGRYFFPK
jgi:hypothetical protein